MHFPKTRRGLFVCVTLILLSAAVVWAATEVTITKSSSKHAYTNTYDGTTVTYVALQEMEDAFYLNYYVYDYATNTYTEQGNGVIDADDASISLSGASLDTDTTDIAIIGEGGQITLDWSTDGLMNTESTSKQTYETGNLKRIVFGGYSQESAVASGEVFGDDYDGTGWLYANKGKVILQIKDSK